MRKPDFHQPVQNGAATFLQKGILLLFTLVLFGNPLLADSSFFSFHFNKATTCKSVNTAFPYDPVNETTSFSTGEKPHAWMEITNVYGTIQGKFEWYKPDGNLYSSAHTGVFQVPNGGWVRMYALENLYTRSGQWRVKCYISHNGGGFHLQKELHFSYGDCACPFVYAPVCGSDGNTYDNACEATCAGVSYTSGECNQGCICPAVFDPVCGSDGNTYGNSCEAQCAGINTWTQGECNTGPSCDLLARITFNTDLCSQCLSEIAVYEYLGRTYLVQDGRNSGCSDAISTVLDCDSGATFCQQGGIAGLNTCGNFFEVATKVEVVLTDDCDQGCVCTQQFDPVCGSDGITYGNSCEAQCAGINTWTQGECSTGPSCDLLARITFNTDLCSQCLSEIAVYEFQGRTYLVQDGRNSGCADAISTVLDCNSGATFCRQGGIAGFSCGNFFEVATKVEVVLTDDCNQGCACPKNYDPVCGSDGNTYGNACEAQCAGINTWTAGECNTCLCPAVAIPVCGSDGNTYINSCEAACADVSWTPGACDENIGCACTNSHADYICDDFQSYDPWQRLGPQSACWTTWTGTQGGAEDGIIQRNNNTHNQYLKIKGNNASGKLQDAVLKLGDKTWGNYTLKFKIWLFSGDKGYYNIQHQFRENATSENEWASQVYFDGHGSGRLIVKNTSHYFTYKMGEWVDVEQRIDLNNDLTDLYIGGHHVRRWKFSDQSRKHAAGTKKLSAIDFYAVGPDYEYYIDDVELSKRSNYANEAEGRSGGEAEDQKEALFVDKLIVAPNPFRSMLTVTIPASIENAQLSVIDQYGRVVQTQDRLDSDASPTVNLDMQDLPAGIYYVRVASGSQILTEKVVKSE